MPSCLVITGVSPKGPEMKSLLRLLAPVLALLGVSVLAGCASAYAPPRPTAAEHTPTPTAELMKATIITAYNARWAAFVHAAETSNADDPALAATMVDPLLSATRQNLATQKAQGIVGRGDITPQPHVDAMTPTTAVVLDCAYSQNIQVYAATGQPVPGQPGGTAPEYDGARTTMVFTPQGWKASDSTVQLGSCPPGY